MNVTSSPRAHALRSELEAWLDGRLTPEIVAAGHGYVTAETLPVWRKWNQDLADAGWAAPSWPVEHGGRAADIDEQVAYMEVMAAAEAPGPINVIGVSNIAPAIMAFGRDDQQAAFLQPMLRGDQIWSQGMSEPDAGSDLASLRTRAERDGESYVINGQKTWNSLGGMADWCQLYVRTDPDAPKHKGISCLLVDLRTPGIEVRPLRTMEGHASFAELFFTDVRVPASALLGPEHGGWKVAMTTLSHERAGVARLHLMMRRKLDALLAEPEVMEALRHRVHRDRVARIHADIATMGWSVQRWLADAQQGKPSASAGSLTKLAWSNADQALAALALELLGIRGTTGSWATNLASSRQTSIAGGTTEINRSIVAEHGLGLPREPS